MGQSRGLLLLPYLLSFTVSAAAEDTVSPLRGTLLRVTAPTVASRRLVGTLVESAEGDLVLALSGSERKVIPRAAVTRLEWSRGRRGHAVHGLITGALVGGATLGLAAGAVCDQEDCTRPAAKGALAGAAVGSLAGAGIGALIRTYGWAEVPVSNVRVSLAPVKASGVAMRLTLEW